MRRARRSDSTVIIAVVLGVGGAALFGFVLLVGGIIWLASGLPTNGFDESKFEVVGQSNGVSIITPTEPQTLNVGGEPVPLKPVSRDNLKECTKIIVEELSLYPPELLRKAKLSRIILCWGLALEGIDAQGVADRERGIILLDLASFDDDDDGPAYLRASVHHELFHLIDYQVHGPDPRDMVWEGLNGPGFRYKCEGAKAPAEAELFAQPTEKFPGFLSPYSMTAAEEDKAEVFAYMVVHPDWVAARAKADPIIRAKVKRIRQILVALHNPANDQFWRRLERERVKVELPIERDE